MQRRHSSASSSDTGSDHGLPSRHTSQENISLIPTRTTKVSTSKPMTNPLQFVKVGPCDLSRYAQEQLKKAEEVKKVKPDKRDEAEDWQSNLDNWKFSRRKRQEHIIERVVEVKKLELEEHDRNRRRSKTFSEMMEERNTKGRKTSLPVYKDDDNDLSDLGLSSPKTNGEDNVFDEDQASSSNELSRSNPVISENKTLHNGHLNSDQREHLTEQEEYTYEQAIQNYVNFTETRVHRKSLPSSDTESSKLINGFTKKSPPPIQTKPRRGSCKIEEKLSEFEQIKKKSMSTNDLTESKKPLSVPKVNILKRREIFEKPLEDETISVNKNRLSGEFGSSKSISDRLSSFSKPAEGLQSIKKSNRISAEISVKDRLSYIEKQTSLDSVPSKSNSSPNNIAMSNTAKQKSSSLHKSSSVEQNYLASENKTVSKSLKEEKKRPPEHEVKGNISNSKIENYKINDNLAKSAVFSSSSTNEPVHNIKEEEERRIEKEIITTVVTSPTEDIYESKRQQHFRHRSLDSLDVESNEGIGNESFERVQSLEDLDFCRNYPPSSVSGDTDREDSGIHTADVSSSVSQADDCDLHLDGDFHQQPTILETIKKNSDITSTLISKQNQTNVSDFVLEIPVEVVNGSEVVENSSNFLKFPLRLECDPLPVILESPSEPTPPISITEFSKSYPPLPFSETNQSSLSNTPNELNFTSNSENEYNSPISSETVNTNCYPETEQCNLVLVDGEGNSASVPVQKAPNTMRTLPVELFSTEVLHDNESGALDICHKIDLGELSSSFPANSAVSVQAEYKYEPDEQKPEVLLLDGSHTNLGPHHLRALTVDVGAKTDSQLLLQPLDTTFPLPDTKTMNGMEAVFPLSPSTLEPPKEKPPPPPTEISDDEDTLNSSKKPVSLRRLDSTKRIKKEIRQKRSSFLGIDGLNDENYLEPELELVRRPPDINAFLAEEKRLEQLLYRQSICSESESRDSGVELEKHNDELTWTTVHHSRDNSETYANVTSEEEEIVKKEREIIEMLEREEINRYSTTTQDKENIGEKLAERLRELEAEKSRLEWQRQEEISRRKADEVARSEHQSQIQARELVLCKQEKTEDVEEMDINTELLMAERERLKAEQAALAHQRDLLLQQQYNRSLTDIRLSGSSYTNSKEYRCSMQDLHAPEPVMTCYRHPVESPPSDNRRSMPDLSVRPRRPPPPIPPAKPLIIPRSQDTRMSSPQQMSRQTLQALSAAPKHRLNDNWVQPKRKSKDSYNYQHWLIQEAEQRRITEHHQRQAPPPRRPVPPPPQQSRGWGNVSNAQYSNWQPPGSQHHSDKPLPDAIIQTLTQRVQNRLHTADPNNNRRRIEPSPPQIESRPYVSPSSESQEKMLSVSGKKKCSHCGDELGRGAAMIIESLRLFYHIDCFKCCVCCVQLGDGLMGTDVRVRNNKLHCHNCYSSDDGVKFSCV